MSRRYTHFIAVVFNWLRFQILLSFRRLVSPVPGLAFVAMARIASGASRFCSAARVYLSTSRNVAWPEMAAIWLALPPDLASLRQVASRSGHCRQKGQVFRRMRGQDLLQVRMNWNLQNHAGLLLPDRNEAVADMLAPHANDVAAPLSGEQKQRKRQPGPGSDRMRRLECRDLFFCPSSEACGCAGFNSNPNSQIIAPRAGRNRDADHRTQSIEKMPRGMGCLDFRQL
jgi:hypothetical protein